jgi:hypothetical protein
VLARRDDPASFIRPLAGLEQRALAAMVTRRRQLVTMLLSERQRLQLAIAVVRPSIEAMIEAIRKPLDDVEAQRAGHVQAHYTALDKLLRSASAIGPVASASLIAGLPELGRLNCPWRNGTTQVEWDSVDFIAKLAALVPPPRVHLTRFHGVFASNAALRAQLTPSGRGKRHATDAASVDVSANDEPRSPEEKRRSMTWAQRLKRAFNINVTTCVHCGGAVRIVASIEEPMVIRAILAHFEKHGAMEQVHYRPAARAPPAMASCARHPHRAS